MSAITAYLKSFAFGRRAFQRFFKRAALLSLEGMNIGTGGGALDNGESYAISYALKGADKPVVFDIGAQGGDYSREALRVTNGAAKIYAFEPRAEDFAALKERLGDTVRLVPKALGDAAGKRELFYPKGGSGLSSFYREDSSFTESEQAETETLDAFCAAEGIAAITLLKLDVEGHELVCLRGARKMLPHIEHIQFEFGIRSRDARVYFRDIFDYLKDYRIYRILKDGLAEVKAPDKFAELLFTTNYLAVRREKGQ